MAGSWAAAVAWDALAKDEEFTETFDVLGQFWQQANTAAPFVQVDGSSRGQLSAAGSAAIFTDGVANGDVSMSVPVLPTSSLQLIARAAYVGQIETAYYLQVNAASYQVIRQTASVQQILYTGGTPAAGDVVKITMTGGTLTFFVNATQLIQLTGETMNATSRTVGIRLSDTTARVDNFTTVLHWTDITQYVRGFQTERGMREVLGRHEAGVLTDLVLDNSDRRFEPLYASSPYYPNVVPGKPVRFQLDGITTWRGSLEEFPADWDDPYETDIKLSGTGSFEQSAQVVLQSPWWYECADVDNGKQTSNPLNRDNTTYPAPATLGWYRFNGDQFNTVAANASAKASAGDGIITGAAKQGASSLVYGDNSGALEFDSQVATGKVALPAATAPYGPMWTVEFMFQISAINDGAIANDYYFIWSQPLKVYYHGHQTTPGTDDGKLLCQLDNPSTNTSFTVKFSTSGLTGLRLDDGQPHHIMIQFGSNLIGDGGFIIDGVSMSTGDRAGSTFTGYFPTPQPWNLGNSSLGGAPKGAIMDELRTYTGSFWDFLHASAADLAKHYSFIANPWSGDTTAQRIQRVLAYSGQPRSRFNIDTPSASVLAPEADVDGKPLIDYLRILERSEGGPVYEQKDGKVRCAWRRARWYDTRSTTVQATFGDQAGESEYEKINVVYTRDRVRNSFSGQSVIGVPVKRVNQTSIDQLGERVFEAENDLRNGNDQDVRDRGDALITKWAFPGQDVRELTIQPVGPSDPLWAIIASAEIGDLWEIRRTRPDGSRIDKLCYVEFIQFEVSSTLSAAPAQTHCIVTLSPVDPYWGVAGSGQSNNLVGVAQVSW